MSAYCASKHAMEGWNDSLREDMYQFGIDVILLEPGFMKTPLVVHMNDQVWKRCVLETPKEILEEYGGEKFSRKLNRSYALSWSLSDDPKKVVNAYVNACISSIPKSRYVVGSGTWLYCFLSYCPAWLRDGFVNLLNSTYLDK